MRPFKIPKVQDLRKKLQSYWLKKIQSLAFFRKKKKKEKKIGQKDFVCMWISFCQDNLWVKKGLYKQQN